MNGGERDNPAKQAFLTALDLPRAERAAWLDEHCPPEVRAEVEALLLRHEQETVSLETPAWELVERDLQANDTPGDETVFEPSESLDEFRILRKVGAGGMAVVYLAEDTSLQRRVALKVLPTSAAFSEVAVARFRQEAVTVAQLQHPNIVPVHRVGHARGVHYLAMEFVDGPTLSARIKEAREAADVEGTSVTRTGVWLREQSLLVAKIADALDHAHRHDVIHRDVKPTNIMLDTDGEPRLTDFGIARNLRLESMTITGQLAGTVPYMSPEQARAASRGIDHRTDIYSLGVTLFEALTLDRPFTGDSAEDIRQKVIWKQPRKVRSLNSSIPRDLETITHKALEKDPVHRYQTAAHMAADLRCFLEGKPILAVPPRPVRRARAWIREHRVASLAALIGVLIAAVAILVAVNHRTRRAAMTPVAITATGAGVRVHVQPFDRLTGLPGRSSRFGDPPIADRLLDPGVYLFTAIDARERFAEAIVYVPRPDERLDPRSGRDEAHLPVSIAFRIPASDSAVHDGMIRVPGGRMTIAPPPSTVTSTANGTTSASRTIDVPDLWVDRCEVSNADYRAFVNATGRPLPFHWSGVDGLVYDVELDDHPVVGVTVADAAAYAHWRGKRLPTEYEWQWVMSRPDGRRRPWGDDEPAGFPRVPPAESAAARGANWHDALELFKRYVHPVDSDPHLDTPLAIRHADSNVREITASFDLARGTTGLARGGAWTDTPDQADLTTRFHFPWNTVSTRRGFRCVRSVKTDIR